MRRSERRITEFDGIHRHMTRLLPDDEYYYTDDENSSVWIEGAWRQRLGLSRPESRVPDDTTDVSGIAQLLGADGRLKTVVFQDAGKIVGAQTPDPEWD